MNFNCIIKTGLVAVAAMVSLSSFSQDLIARQAPIDKKLKTVDSLALQKQIRAEQSEYPRLKSLSKLEQPVCTCLRQCYHPRHLYHRPHRLLYADSEYEDYFAFRSPLEKNAQWSGPEGEHR